MSNEIEIGFDLFLGVLSVFAFLHFNRTLTAITERLNQMADTIVTRDQFDAALARGIAIIVKGFSDLQAEIAAGKVVTPEDFSAELTTLQGGLTAALAADPDADGSQDTPQDPVGEPVDPNAPADPNIPAS